jgi:hypothetical protein
MTAHIMFCHSAAMYKDLKTYTVAGFEPGNFWSRGGRDDHYATPPLLVL